MMNVYLRARVKSITLLPDGKSIQIQTLNMFGSGKLIVPVTDVKSSANCLKDLSPEFMAAVDSSIDKTIDIKALAAAMKKEDHDRLMSSGMFQGSIKLDLKDLHYKLDMDNNGTFHEPELFNTLFNKR